MKSENKIDLDSLNITKGIKKKCISKTCKDITKERNNFYVYHLIDSKTGLPFYVGKGYGNRMYKHAKYVKNGKIPNDNRYLFNKIRKILREGEVIDYKKILENVIEKIAFDKEIQDIKKYGRKNNGTGILCNMTDGGEGTSGWHCSRKTRYRMSKAALKRKNNHWIGKKHTEETKRKMSLAKKGQIPWISGKHHTEESNIKNRESHSEIVISEETKRKMRENHADRCGKNNPMFGRHHTEESKRKMGAAVVNQKGINHPRFGKRLIKHQFQK